MTPTFVSNLLDARWFARVAAIFLTWPYWLSGFEKLGNLSGALSEAQHFGLQPAWLVVAATVLVQIGGSLLVIWGRMAWLGAGALGVFTTAATLIAHRYWEIADVTERFHDRNTFMEHIGLLGGLMIVAIFWHRERDA